jgi:hypothetical protein
MKRVSVPPTLLRLVAFRFIPCCMVALLTTSSVSARPITYTAFTIADGKIGNWSFHNARVYLTMQSDTANIQFFQPPDPFDTSTTIDTYINPVGTSSVTIISGARVVHATFLPYQILVSMDLGNTDSAPHVGARGVGFSSFTATGIEPVYPFGIEDGTLDWGDIVNDSPTPTDGAGVASPALQALPMNLASNVVYSGRAWLCTGFPTDSGPCSPPAPLHTDKGDFSLNLSYQDVDPTGPFYYDPLSAGYFMETLGSSAAPAPALTSTPLVNASKQITYNGYTIADVTLGEHHYKGAQVYISVEADAAATTSFTNGTSHGFINAGGNAHVTVVSGSRTVSADFDPGQLYVYFDVGNASIGFGSWAGRTGYPLSITANHDYDGLVENSSIEAVADIMQTPGDVQYYSAPTAALTTDLTNPTTLSGAASSCVAFDPTSSVCANTTPIPLKTNHGDLYITAPYTADHGSGPYSVSWGVFWSERAQRQHD